MAPKTALLVDADEEIRAMLSRILPAPEWDIREVPDNAAVLELAGSLKFELVLTSERTSGFKDLKLLRKIRQAHSHTRVIVLADESTPADVLEAMRESAFSYFAKPFSLTALEEMVRRAVEEPCWDDGIELLVGSPNRNLVFAPQDVICHGNQIVVKRDAADNAIWRGFNGDYSSCCLLDQTYQRV